MLHSGYFQEYVAALLYFLNILQKRYLKKGTGFYESMQTYV